MSYSSCIMSYMLQVSVCLVRTNWETGSHRVTQAEYGEKFGGRNVPSKSKISSNENLRKQVLFWLNLKNIVGR
jgi:hypothetical protein